MENTQTITNGNFTKSVITKRLVFDIFQSTTDRPGLSDATRTKMRDSNNQLKELIHEQQILEQERQLKLQQLYEMAREEILQKVRNNKNESSKDTIIGLKIMEPLTPEMREEQILQGELGCV